MLISTTPSVDGRRIVNYHGVVVGEAILGANIFRDMFAGIRDLVGGRAGSYEEQLRSARELCMREMSEDAARLGANAIVGVDIDYETINVREGGAMLMVTTSGTAVTVA